LLIGIVKKNAIMMIDFALESERVDGKSPEESIYQGALTRFRPIMMTTAAALMGTLPIALGVGAGAESRRGLGLAVVGGLLFSQVVTLYITPVYYIYLDQLQKKYTNRKVRRKRPRIRFKASRTADETLLPAAISARSSQPVTLSACNALTRRSASSLSERAYEMKTLSMIRSVDPGRQLCEILFDVIQLQDVDILQHPLALAALFQVADLHSVVLKPAMANKYRDGGFEIYWAGSARK
jgi:hypothetical protein